VSAEAVSVLSFGGGLNSSALLIELVRRQETPSAILFADTGAEHPETYAHVEEMRRWLDQQGAGVPITLISNADRPDAPHPSLEAECLTNGTLPSLAFGFKGCSAKWKRQPMDRWIRTWQPAIDAWERGEKVERLIGIDAGEAHRSQALIETEDPRFVYRRPLVEWNIDREGCEEILRGAGLPVPNKSACWFCPAAKKREVLNLADEKPKLFERAVAMERNARDAGGLKQIEGLGRSWSWEALVRADRAQLKLFPEPTDAPCGCYDGESEEVSR
jgi:hypothetical protein